MRKLSTRIYTSDNGFTLIELLLVIAILSILILAVMLALNPFEQIKKANDGRRKSDLSEIQKALEVYYQDNGSYPPQKSGTYTPDWGNNQAQYIPKMPQDPKGYTYAYGTTQDLQQYAIYTTLERGAKDPQAVQICGTDGSKCNYYNFGLSQQACSAIGCNYGVSSPNTTP